MPTPPTPWRPGVLDALEHQAAGAGLVLRLRSGPALPWRGLQVAVARREGPSLRLAGDLRGWVLPTPAGLHLDTLRVSDGRGGVGALIWAATMAWALEASPCRRARLLAIRDDDRQHARLVRYFRRLGFRPLRDLGASPADLPLRMIWGGAGLLMAGDCREVLDRALGQWRLRCRLSGSQAYDPAPEPRAGHSRLLPEPPV